MEQLNSNIERVIEANSTIEVFNTGAFYALVRAYKYVVVDNKPVKEKINVPFSFDLYNKDNDKISTGTISPGEKATFKVPTYKMVINNTYDYEVHIVFSFGSGTVDQLKTDLELTIEDLSALTKYDKLDFERLDNISNRATASFEKLDNISQKTTASYEELDQINALLTAETLYDKTPKLLQKIPIFISLDSSVNTYFNVIELILRDAGGPISPHFITHIDIGVDYSQAHGVSTNLYVTNTFNPGMSFGQYEQLKNLKPQTRGKWDEIKWTKRADIGLPTRSSSVTILGGQVHTDGSFRIDINETYGTEGYFNINNFILKTDIINAYKVGSGSRKVAIRRYDDDYLGASAGIAAKVLPGNFNFVEYNLCDSQIPLQNVNANMIMVDVSIYGYLTPVP